MTEFLAEIASATKVRQKIFINMGGVVELTPDAVTVLLAQVYGLGANVITGGNVPTDPKIRSILFQSGFFQHVRIRGKVTAEQRGTIERRMAFKVEPKAAERMIASASTMLYGERRRCKGVYRALIECMSNTHEHAGRKTEASERWWATSYHDPDTNTASFTVVDSGVGIFESVKLKRVRQILRTLGLHDNAALLKDLLHGNLGSRTGLSYRGKGLPTIYRSAITKQIRNLVVVTNDVYGDVDKDVYRRLRQPFRGTLVHWEIGGPS